MANITLNIGKGRIVELYKRVKTADPATCAFIIVPIETTGLETDSVLKDKRTLAAFLSGATNEQVTMGRKVLVAGDLDPLPTPDDVDDRYEVGLPAVTWLAATGNPISKMLVCYRAATGDADTLIEPLTMFDFPAIPSGLAIVVNASMFFRAGE